MTNPDNSRLQEIAAAWRAARRVYPTYAAVIARFKLPIEPCRHLESPIDRNDPEAVEEIGRWLDQAEAKIEASQLRKILQSQQVGADAAMRALLQRYLAKPDGATTYRDRIDFLIAQYFTHLAPLSMARGKVRFDEVARVLEPVIGEVPPIMPDWVEELDLLVSKLEQCESLRDLTSERLLEEGRELKNRCGASFTEPASLVAFARYNFLVRRAFIRLLHNDLDSVPRMLDELHKRGVSSVDCRTAGLSETATLGEISHYCRNWKSIFRANFNERDVSNAVVLILEACERKLASTPPPSPKPKPVESAAPVPQPKPQPAPAPVAAVAPAKQPVPAVPSPKLPQPEPRPAVRFSMEQAVMLITDQLFRDERFQAKLATGTVTLGETKMVLSSWEVAAFVKGADAFSRALQYAVAARAVVAEAVERRKLAQPVELKPILDIGHSEAAHLQEQIAQARDTRNIDAAVNLAATQKRLLQVIEQAEKAQAGSAQ